MSDIQDKNDKLAKKRESSKNWGWAVYIGGIAVAWAFALAFFVGAFKGNSFLQIIVSVGVTFVSINAVVLANALHHYAVSGTHRILAIVLYAVDLLLMVVNVLVSAGELTGQMPEWAKVYEPYAYSTVVVPVITWGVLWMLDPHQEADVKLQQAKDKFVLNVIQNAQNMIDGAEGQQIVADVAASMAREQLMDPRALIGAANTARMNTGAGTVKADNPAPVSEAQLTAMLEAAGLNGNSPTVAKEILAMVNPTKASISQN